MIVLEVVPLANGTTKPIADVEVGDEVLATNTETGETQARIVTDTMVMHHDGDLLDLTIEDDDGHGVIQTTDRHGFWSVTDQRWEDAIHLTEGEQLRQADGSVATVTAVDERDGTQDMHDLTVAVDQNFYVAIGNDAGDPAALVHNKCVNLPSWNKLDVDMDHIRSGHMPGGSRVSPNKTLFENMNEGQVRDAIRDAYNNGRRVQTQVGPDGATRLLVRGEGAGRTIEMWVNTTTNIVETAYPVF